MRLRCCRATLQWRFEHIGGGDQLDRLRLLAERLGISARSPGTARCAQEEVLEHYRRADIFALACRIAADGDRDGLPNVLVEAASQKLACVSTDVSGVPELLVDEENGLLVPPGRSTGAWPCARTRDPPAGPSKASRRSR